MLLRPEIMAPVGGAEQLLAAVRCGADAVYLGGKGFNARRNAANFSDTDLGDVVSYCHGRGVKVYVTVNTLVMDSEREALEREADAVAASGADAVIIQDMAVLKLFSNRYPSMLRFASTQTAVHNVDGARFLQDMGFDSVVLARELTLKEIEKICSAVDVKAEAFVHGAHCMSVSGACYVSSLFGGRSGNRGLCAQPCRLDWRCGEKSFALSLKDMSLLPHVRDMAEAGVGFLKIEGRMKRPEYVAAAVTACKNALEGKPYDLDTLKAVFSRSGFTDGYLMGKRTGEMFGYRTKEDVTGAEGVLSGLSGLYRNETPRVPVDLAFEMDQDGSRLTLSDGEHSLTVEGPRPEEARNRPLDQEGARKNLTKVGGTPFSVGGFSAKIAPGLMLRASDLNALRREGLEQLLALRSQVQPHTPEGYQAARPKPYRSPLEQPAFSARFFRPEQITGEESLSRIILPTESITPDCIARYGEKLVAQLPTILFPKDEPALRETLTGLKAQGLGAVYANNIYGIRLGKDLGLDVHGGFGLNVINTEALLAYQAQGLKSLTVSFELAMQKIRTLGGDLPRGIVAYGRLPLMHFRNCPVKAAIGCAACGERGHLTDRMQVDFPVECDHKRVSILLNSVPLDIAERCPRDVDDLLLYFTAETKAEAAAVIDRFARGEKTNAPHTAGLYFRELI